MKIKITAILLINFILLWKDAKPYLAQGDNPCALDPGKVTYQDIEIYGFDITRAEMTFPEYPIVIGQDMEEQTGVDITVEIQSSPGEIDYQTFDGYTEECVGPTVWEDGPESCPPYYANGKHYFNRQIPICTAHEEKEVYRTINGESLKVWLVPTDETLKWLGWNTEGTEGKYPLRYMFPEMWALGTWTPGGFTTVGSYFMFTEEQIEAFIAANPGFEFLKGDPRMEDIPTYALQRVRDPNLPTQRVLALFGEYINWYTQGTTKIGGPCLVDRPGTKGRCQTATNLTVGDPSKAAFNADLSAEGITYLRVELLNVPMNLPGDWYIGVSITVRPAKYGKGQRTETVEDQSKLHRDPTSGYSLDDHSFTTYILISTLCNSAEIDGCTR
jgi:hypothetical protein